MNEDLVEKAVMLYEIRGVYDGWSVAEMPDGSLVNRWPPDSHRHAPTQEFIKELLKEKAQ